MRVAARLITTNINTQRNVLRPRSELTTAHLVLGAGTRLDDALQRRVGIDMAGTGAILQFRRGVFHVAVLGVRRRLVIALVAARARRRVRRARPGDLLGIGGVTPGTG